MVRFAIGFGMGILMSGALFTFLCPECLGQELATPDSAPYPAPYPVPYPIHTATERPRPTRTATPGGPTPTVTNTPKTSPATALPWQLTLRAMLTEAAATPGLDKQP